MEKVKVSQEIANAIKNIKQPEGAIEHHVMRRNFVTEKKKALNSLTLDELIRAIYVGYEVVEKFSKGDWVVVTFELHATIYGKIKKITDVKESLAAGHDVYFNLEGDGVVYQNEIRHARPEEIEIAEEKERRTDKKLDDLLLNLSNKERVRLCNKLICLESDSDE